MSTESYAKDQPELDPSQLGLVELLSRLAEYDREADWILFMRQQSGLIGHVCRSYLDRDYLIEDAIQETILAIRDDLAGRQFLNHRLAQAWITTIARNTSHNLRERENARARMHQRLANEPVAPTGDETEDESAAAWHQRFAEVLQAVQALPPQQRQVVKLRYLDGMDNETIAKQLAMTRKNVENTLWRALARVRKSMPGGMSACAVFGLLRDLPSQAHATGTATSLVTAKSGGALAAKTGWPLAVKIAGGVLGLGLITGAGIVVYSMGNQDAVAVTMPAPAPTTIGASSKDRQESMEQFIARFKSDHPDWRQMDSRVIGSVTNAWESAAIRRGGRLYSSPWSIDPRKQAALACLVIHKVRNGSIPKTALGWIPFHAKIGSFEGVEAECPESSLTILTRSDEHGIQSWSKQGSISTHVNLALDMQKNEMALCVKVDLHSNREPAVKVADLTVLIADIGKGSSDIPRKTP